MNRWPSAFLHHWRTKLVSLALATLVWFILRHLVPPTLAGSSPVVSPPPAQIP